MSTTPKILNPTKPSECVAALSMSEKDAEHPYASILYTTHEGLITFFGLRVTGVQQAEEGQMLTYPMTRFNSEANEWQTTDTTNPDEAGYVIEGTLENGVMVLQGDGDNELTLADMNEATDFVSIIRMVYSMEAQGA